MENPSILCYSYFVPRLQPKTRTQNGLAQTFILSDYTEVIKMFITIPADQKSLENRRLIRGVATNDANYQVNPSVNGKKLWCPFYLRWKNMIQRCYSKEYQSRFPTYKGCSVCSEWLLFSNFKRWMKKQDWKGKQLDKDLLIFGNKEYSPDACIFVSVAINSLVLHPSKSKSKYPLGVYKCNSSGLYVAQCKKQNKPICIGRFKTPELAFDAYKKYKYKLIRDIANQQVEPLKTALLSYRIT